MFGINTICFGMWMRIRRSENIRIDDDDVGDIILCLSKSENRQKKDPNT